MGGLNNQEFVLRYIFVSWISVWVIFECYQAMSASVRHWRAIIPRTELLELLLDIDNLRCCSQLEITVVIPIVVEFDHRDSLARSVDREGGIDVAGGMRHPTSSAVLDVATLHPLNHSPSYRRTLAVSLIAQRGTRRTLFRGSGSFVTLSWCAG